MASININEDLRSDPRFHALCNLLPRHIAYGALICFWETGQTFWRKNKSLIPNKLAQLTPNFAELVAAGFAAEVPGEGVYCTGAKERWGFLLTNIEKASNAGKRSAEVRREKYGTAIPFNAPNSEKNTDHSAQKTELKAEPPSELPNLFVFDSVFVSDFGSDCDSDFGKEEETTGVEIDISPAPAPSDPQLGFSSPELEPPKKTKAEVVKPTTVIWEVYAQEFKQRYSQDPPPRNAKINGQLTSLIKQYGLEPTVDLVRYYFEIPNPYYRQKFFPIGLLLLDSHQIFASMTTKICMSRSEVIQLDRQQAVRSQLQRIENGEI
jgi:hypothetical protein